MNRTVSILGVILLVQVILSIALFSFDSGSQSFATDQKLIAVTLDQVDRIRIEDGGKHTVNLTRKDDRWILPDLYDFPASKEKLDRVMNKLLDAARGWPVATTAGAAKRFKVSEEAFERRINFDKGDKTVQTLFIGTSPGFKKVHVRLAGENDIYAIAFSAFEVPAKADDWSDKSFLHLAPETIVKARLPSFEIERTDDGTAAIVDPGEGKESNREAVDNLLLKLARLNFRSVLGTGDKPEYNLAKPSFEYTLTPKEGEPVTYRFGERKEQKDFVLKTSAHPYYFTVTQYTLDGIRQTTRDSLIQDKKPEEPPTDTKPPAKETDDAAADAAVTGGKDTPREGNPEDKENAATDNPAKASATDAP